MGSEWYLRRWSIRDPDEIGLDGSGSYLQVERRASPQISLKLLCFSLSPISGTGIDVYINLSPRSYTESLSRNPALRTFLPHPKRVTFYFPLQALHNAVPPVSLLATVPNSRHLCEPRRVAAALVAAPEEHVAARGAARSCGARLATLEGAQPTARLRARRLLRRKGELARAHGSNRARSRARAHEHAFTPPRRHAHAFTRSQAHAH
eukprot:6191604-Pleurochrysis_carterae.AAC.1